MEGESESEKAKTLDLLLLNVNTVKICGLWDFMTAISKGLQAKE